MKLIAACLLLCFSSSALANPHCGRYLSDARKTEVLESLADELLYSYDELCSHARIQNIQMEQGEFYYDDTKEFEVHDIVTIHYNEYSCEYHHNVARKLWQSGLHRCYNTW